MANILNLGLSGLQAARAGLNVTGQNINNLNTPGYHRKNLVQSAVYPVSAGYGFPGEGVRLDDVRRVYDQFLDREVQVATSKDAYYKTQNTYLEQLDAVIANSNNGVSPRLQSFFSSLQTLTSDPASIPSRQAVVDQMSSLVTTMKSSDSRINELRDGVNVEVKSAVTAINSLAQEVANLNKQISYLWRRDNARLPNDLIDKRDQAITELSKYIDVKSVGLDNGGVNVYMGQGQSLVLHDSAMRLEAAISEEAGRESELGVFYTKGGRVEIPADMLTGGSLGGALTVRKTLDETQQRMGQMAMELARRMNEQNRQGIDFNGDPGEDLFNLNYSFPPLNQDAHGAGGNAGLNPTAAYLKLNPGEQLAVQQRYAVRALELSKMDARKLAAASAFAFDAAGSVKDPKSSLVISSVSTTLPFNKAAPIPTMPIDIKFDGANYSVASPTTPAGMQVRSVPGVTGGYELVDSSNSPMGVKFIITGLGVPNDTLRISARPQPFTDIGNNSNLLEIANLQIKETIVPQVKANEASVKLLNDATETQPTGGKPAYTSSSLITAQGSFVSDNNRITFVMPAQEPNSKAEADQRNLLSKLPLTMTFNGAGFDNVPEGFNISRYDATNNIAVLSANGAGGKAMMLIQLKPNGGGTLTNPSKTTFTSPASNNLQASFGQLATIVGSRTNEVQVVGNAAKTTLRQVTDQRQSVSGVNLDEEAVNLMKYQQAYQAASKAIQVGQGLFDAVLQALR